MYKKYKMKSRKTKKQRGGGKKTKKVTSKTRKTKKGGSNQKARTTVKISNNDKNIEIEASEVGDLWECECKDSKMKLRKGHNKKGHVDRNNNKITKIGMKECDCEIDKDKADSRELEMMMNKN
ncbi:hypothetical protein JO84_gp049 [Aureococcus anophagefferens virus]|uniref:Uncharacterized protein n=1 Tax=Aureococcus anophagefferens virus TaxID=1474867 RepID=A0A076FFG0_9VIRU|nr:hypothetical protein JO84_gp049 [Aureococcus anophagefferens virus]AII16979.1 hypothetical protein AaV_049 [Aureococcus anophagefferens virus]UOG94351.1 hypothetical protein MKD35_316 [Aureococcus anophagefferens virus]